MTEGPIVDRSEHYLADLLDHQSESVAEQIYTIFQLSYAVEAEFIGVEIFPPLRRTASNIRLSTSRFMGYSTEDHLTAAIEFACNGDDLSINSLVVHPKYFRRGLASKLLRSLLAGVDWKTANVETAVANAPAILLYQKLGFSELKRYEADEGIMKVRMISSQNK